MRRRLGMLIPASVALQFIIGSGAITSAGQSTFNRIATGQLKPAVLHVNGVTDRAGGVNVRVNQDCTYRRQAEQHLAFNPTDPDNLVAGMNDSLTGWNLTSLDFSLDAGKH